MKKRALLFCAGFMPYSVVLGWICVFADVFGKPITAFGLLWLLLFPAAVWLAGLIGVKIFLRGAEQEKLVRINRTVKLLQVPAYLAIFLMALPMLTIPFTWMFVILFVIQDWMAIFLTGQIGCAAVRWCGENGILTQKQTTRHGRLQFVFCADVFSAVWIYHESKKSKESLS